MSAVRVAGLTPSSVTSRSACVRSRNVRTPMTPNFEWSARTHVRRALSMSARFVSASTKSSVVSPASMSIINPTCGASHFDLSVSCQLFGLPSLLDRLTSLADA